jgi:hypothetical protein
MFSSQDGQPSGGKDKVAAEVGSKAEPGGDQDTEDMGVGEQESVSVDVPGPVQDPCHPFCNVGGAFPAGGAVPPEVPGRGFFMDCGHRLSFVESVVPFHQVGIDGGSGKPGQSGCPKGSRERARKDEPGRIIPEKASQTAGLFLSLLGQGKIGAARELTARGPESGPVANEKNAHPAVSLMTDPVELLGFFTRC